jgi:acetylornithine deacetylase/succinyl-diaminopimelate desuccinylase-like protein
VETEHIVPDFVVVGEATNRDIYLGQRGRVEFQGVVTGRAGHGSAPARADSAIDKALPVLDAIRRMSGTLGRHDFLGDGSIAVTRVHAAAGSVNVIPDRCEFMIDRRLTVGEAAESALTERESLPAARAAGARFTIPMWEQPSYTGFVLRQPLVFPPWLMPEDAPLVRGATCGAGISRRTVCIGTASVASRPSASAPAPNCMRTPSSIKSPPPKSSPPPNSTPASPWRSTKRSKAQRAQRGSVGSGSSHRSVAERQG